MKFSTTISFILLSILSFSQVLKTPVKSPLSSIKQAIGLSDISIEYSRPSKNGRVIFGDVVPFGDLWRMGANAATKITFGEDVSLNGKLIKAGSYSLFAIPTKEEWTIILNKNTNLWGSADYKQEEDEARFIVKVQKTAELIETFTIQFNNLKQTACTLDFAWENTKVSLDISIQVDEKVMKSIEAIMFQDKRPYHLAAQYYFDNKKDMKQALDWATKAFEFNPKAYWSALLKAKIQIELKDFKAAKTTLGVVKTLAEADKDPAYVKQAEELMKTIN